MTTQLAETIARFEKSSCVMGIDDHERRIWRTEEADALVLLACARRCEAIELVGSHVIGRALNAIDCRGRAADGKVYANIEADDLRILVDAASERDALAKRVGEREVLLDDNTPATVELESSLGAIAILRVSPHEWWRFSEADAARGRASWSDDAHARQLTDPEQIARVRAIVADLKGEAEIKSHLDAFEPTAEDIEASMAAKASAGGVSSSGEVKSPFGLEPDSEGNVCFGPIRFSYARHEDGEPTWFLTIDNIERTEDPETLFRQIAAVLSEHIRRVDAI